MQINPYLLFNGQCEEAMRFYEKCLDGKITMIMTYGESPAASHVPAELTKQVIHGTLTVDDFQLQASDCPPDKYQKPQGFSVTLQISEVAKAESVFKALSEGGKITMPFGQTFWAKGFGMAEDKFGIPWMVNCG
ncbi:MAG TPA: VOC family protein [Terriglobales bacterium]|nr:VOC family protein [Terriglobales bacterium]